MAHVPDDHDHDHKQAEFAPQINDHDLMDFNDNDSLKNNLDANELDNMEHMEQMAQIAQMEQESMENHQQDQQTQSPTTTSAVPTTSLNASSALTQQSLQHFNTQHPPLAQSLPALPDDSADADLDIMGNIGPGVAFDEHSQVTELMVQQLAEMGFSRDKSLYALNQSFVINHMVSVEYAIQWLFDNPNFEPPVPDAAAIGNTINRMLGHDIIGALGPLGDVPMTINGSVNKEAALPPPNNSPDQNAITAAQQPQAQGSHADVETFLYHLMDGYNKDAQHANLSKSDRIYAHSATMDSAATSTDTALAADEQKAAAQQIHHQIHHQSSTSNVTTSELSALSTGLRSQSPSITTTATNHAPTTSTTATTANSNTLLAMASQLTQLYQQQHAMDALSKHALSTDLIPDDLKMVIVVRKDLKMTAGKVAAQCCHGCLGVVMDIINQQHVGGNDNGNSNRNSKHAYDVRKILRLWRNNGEKKIVLTCSGEQQLMELRQQALIHNLPHYLVTDAGHTQIAAGSKTVLAIGPYPSVDVDQVTGNLSLYK